MPAPTNATEARAYYEQLIESQERCLADPRCFSTIDPNYLIEFAKDRIRWVDCAPEGARFIVAPMCGKSGIPLDTINDNENVGPGRELREARIARGLNPFTGRKEQ